MKKPLPPPQPLAAFFLETLTPQGQVLLWEPLAAPDLDGMTLLLGREGPDSHGVLDQLLSAAQDRGLSPQRLLSPLNPAKTAGLVLPGRKLAAYCAQTSEDAPWLLPGVCEREIDCTGCPQDLPGDLRQQLWELYRLHREETGRAVRLLRTAQLLLRENDLRLLSAADLGKLSRTAGRLLRRECGRVRSGVEQKRFLTAFTGQGLCCCRDTLLVLTPRAILFDDPFGALAGRAMAVLREELLRSGQEFISCWSPLEPGRVEHLLLPDQGLCLLTSSCLPLPRLPEQRRAIHYTRFCDASRLEPHRQKLRLTRRMAGELLEEACLAQKRAAGARLLGEELLAPYLPKAFSEGQRALALRLGLGQMEMGGTC